MTGCTGRQGFDAVGPAGRCIPGESPFVMAHLHQHKPLPNPSVADNLICNQAHIAGSLRKQALGKATDNKQHSLRLACIFLSCRLEVVSLVIALLPDAAGVKVRDVSPLKLLCSLFGMLNFGQVIVQGLHDIALASTCWLLGLGLHLLAEMCVLCGDQTRARYVFAVHWLGGS